MITNLTQQQIENIQIDEGILFVNYGENDERMLAPTRGGGEFTVTNNVRGIEHDGQPGDEAGLQVVDSQIATLKVTVLDNGQENIALSIPGCVIEPDGSITNGDNGVIPEDKCLKNVTMFSKMLSGKYKKIELYRAMHKGALSTKATPKAEGELALEFSGHFNPKNKAEKLWRISEVEESAIPAGEEE